MNIHNGNLWKEEGDLLRLGGNVLIPTVECSSETRELSFQEGENIFGIRMSARVKK